MKKIVVSTVVTVVFVTLMSQISFALERFTIISTEEMKQLVRDREMGITDFILVNTLDEMIYRDSCIPGSINIPLGKLDEMADKLGTDYHKRVITYCMGYR